MRTLGFAIFLLAGFSTPALCESYSDFNAGLAAYNHRDWNNAVILFDKALAAGDLVPDLRYVAHRDRGEAYAGEGRWDAAIDDFTIFLGQRSSDQGTLFLRATAYAVTGKLDAALGDIDRVLADDPGNGEALLRRIHIFEVKGDFQSQLREAQAYETKFPTARNSFFEIGIANVLLGRADDASSALEKLIGTSYFNNPTAYAYGWIWLALNDAKSGKPVSRKISMGFDLNRWPGPIVSFIQGEATADAVYAAATQGDAGVQSVRTCEANLYLGEWRLYHGDTGGAKTLIQQAGQECPVGSDEWYFVMAELKNVL